MQFIEGIPVFGTPDPGAMSQIITCAKTADHVALMGDHHKGYAVPIGGVVAYKDYISPSGVGFDIGCGNKAVRLDTDLAHVRKNIKEIMNDVYTKISFGMGRTNNETVEHEIFERDFPGWDLESTRPLKRMAQNQLGTVGSGNHYVDIFSDEWDRVWVGVHFGSRGLGHKTATWFLEKAGAKDGMDVEPCILRAESDLGMQYIRGMELAGKYAYAGRDWVCAKVASILGGQILEEVHNHHNFAWREQHQGVDLWVVRKGATPAFPGQRGFVGGSMGESSVILEGQESPLNVYTLNSTVHGAGRVMGRMDALGKPSRPARIGQGGQVIDANPGRPARVTQEMMDEWMTHVGVELRGGGRDESPHCYKRLTEVLATHMDTVKVLHILKPLGVAMAGKDIVDPFKD